MTTELDVMKSRLDQMNYSNIYFACFKDREVTIFFKSGGLKSWLAPTDEKISILKQKFIEHLGQHNILDLS